MGKKYEGCGIKNSNINSEGVHMLVQLILESMIKNVHVGDPSLPHEEEDSMT